MENVSDDLGGSIELCSLYGCPRHWGKHRILSSHVPNISVDQDNHAPPLEHLETHTLFQVCCSFLWFFWCREIIQKGHDCSRGMAKKNWLQKCLDWKIWSHGRRKMTTLWSVQGIAFHCGWWQLDGCWGWWGQSHGCWWSDGRACWTQPQSHRRGVPSAGRWAPWWQLRVSCFFFSHENLSWMSLQPCKSALCGPSHTSRSSRVKEHCI